MLGPSENQELHALYQFGQQDSASPRLAGEQEGSAAANGRGDRNSDGDDAGGDYSPQEERYNGVPSSPGAFGGGDDTYVPTGNGNAGSYGAATFDGANEGKHHKGGSKTSVVKKIVGMDKKSTKGMTDEEKKAAKLQERWRNAQLEEQRLNELEGRLAQEETMTQAIGQAPNFPPKILCIRPLVYHKISAVNDDRRRFVTIAFWDWVAVCIVLVANCPITIACNAAPPREGVTIIRDINKGLNIVLSCIYLVGIPLGFLMWYWPIYQSNYTRQPMQHVLALCGLLIALAQAIFAFVGPSSYGFCGVISSKWVGDTRDKGVVAPMAVVTALWGVQMAFTCYMLVQVFIYYRKDLAARRAARRHQVAAGQ